MVITVREHSRIEPELLEAFDGDSLRRRVNYDTSRFDASKINLMRYEFDPQAGRDGFYSYFRIGAEWLDEDCTVALTVVPKMENIDFVAMFTECLATSGPADGFSETFDIDFDARPIRCRALTSVLSPLLAVQYLAAVQCVVAHGLRKDYVPRSENLGKVKGRIDIMRNERKNIVAGHRERVFCRFDEYTVDTPENRFLRRALVIARDIVSQLRGHRTYAALSAICGTCLCAFESVADSVDAPAVSCLKTDKIHRGYAEAIRLAKMMVRHHDISLNKRREAEDDTVPVFRIDMSLLFEHYALAALRRRFGYKAVNYQVKGYGGRFIADFLITKGNLHVIADAKYVDDTNSTVAKPEYIKQLSAYSRDTELLHALGYDTSAGLPPVVPCVLLCPTCETSGKIRPVKATVRFYTCPIPLPLI